MTQVLERAYHAAASVLPRFDVERAYAFGSQARGDAGAQSDLDVRIIRGPYLDFGDLAEIRLEFSRLCGVDVDVVCAREKDLDRRLLTEMTRDQVCIYER